MQYSLKFLYFKMVSTLIYYMSDICYWVYYLNLYIFTNKSFLGFESCCKPIL